MACILLGYLMGTIGSLLGVYWESIRSLLGTIGSLLGVYWELLGVSQWAWFLWGLMGSYGVSVYYSVTIPLIVYYSVTIPLIV